MTAWSRNKPQRSGPPAAFSLHGAKVCKWPTASVTSIRLARKVSGDKLPDSSGSPHLSDIKGLEVFRAAVGKFVVGIGGRATGLEAWQELPPPLQQRAIVIRTMASRNASRRWSGRQ
jgi:hypothetical protein